jgi:hypothetical protein
LTISGSWHTFTVGKSLLSFPGDFAMANAIGVPCINVRNGKFSHLTVLDPSGAMTDAADVTSVKDGANSLTWTPKKIGKVKVVGRASKMKIQLKGTWVPTRDFDNPPDSGSLTITLTNGPPVTDMPVDYLDDTGA